MIGTAIAILRCPHCQFLQEVANQHIGKTVSCPRCQQKAKVFDTVKLVDTVLSQSVQRVQDYKKLKQTLTQLAQRHIALNREKNALQAQLEQLYEKNHRELADSFVTEFDAGYAFENQDYSTVLNNFQPIVDWFKQHQIAIEPNTKASDISGYFDEIAVMLGDNLAALSKLLEGIRYRQRKGYEKFTVDLSDYSKAEAKLLKRFCKTAYEFAFFTKYYFHKDKNTIFLALNDSPQIQQFFNGDWLEWYGFMKVASFLLAKKQTFACLRSSMITSAKQHEQNETDMFFLINQQQPLWIECKSGEFRDSINKYQELRKRLKLDPKYAILLVAELENEKAAAMSSMFKLTIVNESGLLKYLASVFDFPSSA